MQGIKLTSQRRGEVSNVNDTRSTHTSKKTTKTKKGVGEGCPCGAREGGHEVSAPKGIEGQNGQSGDSEDSGSW